eukprot:10044704-Karenia_brevis.AAC.1
MKKFERDITGKGPLSHEAFPRALTTNVPKVVQWHRHFPKHVRESQLTNLSALASMNVRADEWYEQLGGSSK